MARWPLLGGLVAGAFLLGLAGFGQYFEDRSAPRPLTDLAYLSLQLFVLDSGGVAGPIPWPLEVARFLAPASTATAIVLTLAAVFSEQAAAVRLRRTRDHIVVCGLGERGGGLARSLLAAGHRVVAVDQDPANREIPDLRRAGALIVVGDARSPDVLRRARVAEARTLVALAAADDINAEVAVRAGELARPGSRAMTCLAHVQDPVLCELLQSRQLAGGYGPGYRLDFFNVFEQGARTLLREHVATLQGPEAPRLAVIGLTPLGRALILEAARQWRLTRPSPGRRIVIAVLDPAARSVVRELEAGHPRLGQVADLRCTSPDEAPTDLRPLSAERWGAVFVCVGEPSRALRIALEVRQHLPDPSTSIVAELGRAPGLTGLLEHAAVESGLHAFDLLDRTLRPELILGGTYELLARAIHDEYVAGQAQAGTAAGNPSAVPWDQLGDSLRESNRDQAAHIGVKLAAIGCGISTLRDWDAEELRFSEAEVERLAEMEHERWTDQRLRDGWTLGARDVARKSSPYLVPWGQLGDEVRELDRRTVRGIPSFLARAGYQVLRAPAPTMPSGSPGRSTR